MRIVFYSYGLNGLTGVERGVISRANEYANRGHEVYILCERDYNPDGPVVTPLSEKVKIVDFMTLMHHPHDLNISFSGIIPAITYFRAVDRWIKAIKPDVLISHGSECARAFHIVNHHGAAFIYEFDKTLDPNEFKPRLIDRLINSCFRFKVDKYVALTHKDLEFFKGPKNKIEVIPNPVYIQAKPADVTNSKIVVSTGRLHFEKNYEFLINAFSIVHSHYPDWQLHIYGDGDQYESLNELISKLHLSDAVKMKGRTADVASALASGSIFALSSRCEGFPLSVIEAMACGLPVVVTEVNGNHEIIDGNDVGFIVPQGELDQFAKHLIFLIENPQKRIELGEKAIIRSRDFDLKSIIDRQEAMIEQVVSEKKFRLLKR